jgi:hypothetical protein
LFNTLVVGQRFSVTNDENSCRNSLVYGLFGNKHEILCVADKNIWTLGLGLLPGIFDLWVDRSLSRTCKHNFEKKNSNFYKINLQNHAKISFGEGQVQTSISAHQDYWEKYALTINLFRCNLLFKSRMQSYIQKIYLPVA